MNGILHISLAAGILVCLVGCGGGTSGGESAPTPAPEVPAGLSGTWKGDLSVQGTELPLVFHFHLEDGAVTGSMDSPAQGAYGIAMEHIDITDGSFSASYMKGTAKLEGTLDGLPEHINAEWVQGGARFPLRLSESEGGQPPARPQEPERPFSYREEEVTFTNNAAGITFTGTLTLPEGNGSFPAVVLISGSGQQNRNEEIFGHKPFLVLSDYLTRRGYAVLRYDDRGMGSSGGAEGLAEATTMDFAGDAAAALAFLRGRPETREDAIGVIGHSEGGEIAQILAAGAAGDRGPDFVVMMAGPALPGIETMIHQTEAVMQSGGASEEAVKAVQEMNTEVYKLLLEPPSAENEKAVRKVLDESGMPDDQVDGQMQLLTSGWYRAFLAFDPGKYIPKIDVPVLALFGEKDVQVVAEYEAPRMRELLADSDSSDITVEVLPGLNHLFQEAETGSVDEYAVIEQTLSPVFLEYLGRWLDERVK